MSSSEKNSHSRSGQRSFQFKGRKKSKVGRDHGGEEYGRRRERKGERPFDPAKRLHVTLRSSKAVGERSLLHPFRSRRVKAIVITAAKRHGIVLERYVCVGNHLHLLIRTKSSRRSQARLALRGFLKEVTGLIARLVSGAKKGVPSPFGKFWDHLAWSRIVEWGRDLKGIHRYFEKNFREFVGILAQNNWPSPELPP